STRIAEEMQENAARFIEETFGKAYQGDGRKEKKGGRIQDAHEAIRPTDLSLSPQTIADSLSRDQLRLYQLIYNRFLASRMASAQYLTQHIAVEGGRFLFEAAGSVLDFPGFMKVYSEDTVDEGALKGLDQLKEGESFILKDVDKAQHFTQPPARYTEGLLVRAMEENGVGRPSTYAPTISTLIGRGYVTKEKKALYVTELGSLVRGLISEYFESIDDISFTAHMENELDRVEEGELDWKEVLRSFYQTFKPQLEKAEAEMEKVVIEDEVTDEICDKCGRNMVLKIGRFGKFYACPGFPECRNTKPYLEKIGVTCEKCGGQILVKRSKKGRIYYGCENNPTCDFMSWEKPTGKICPACGGRLYEKQGRVKKLVCLNQDCRYTQIEEES
ncbi:MAG: type I DNA topoisomerase, partial [Firmicutes bacterium]|nr:type I DNA topoisomerase [Bacillota bacterium]